jgi:hypothetical protein
MALLPSVTSTALVPMVSAVPPSSSISTPTITYNQLMNSLGTYDYGSEFLYLSSTTFKQISQPFFYTHFNAAGNQVSSYLAFAIDPYQQQSSIYYETRSDEVIFDGFASLTFVLYAQEIVYFKMFALVEYMGGDLEQYGDNNFEALEKAEGVKIFEDYCNYLIDQE